MKYIIMADGKSSRWRDFKGIPKHFIEINGETLIERTVRLFREKDDNCEIIITSHDSRYEIEGATRYEPENNVLEIDRFTEELIEDDICFLYGDTYYSDETADMIVSTAAEELLFFGNVNSIVAVKVKDSAVFRHHVARVRQLFLEGKIDKCIGWQVYQSYMGLEFGKKQIAGNYILINDATRDYNCPEDVKNI